MVAVVAVVFESGGAACLRGLGERVVVLGGHARAVRPAALDLWCLEGVAVIGGGERPPSNPDRREERRRFLSEP